MKTGRLLDVLSGHEGPVHGLMFSPTSVSNCCLFVVCNIAYKSLSSSLYFKYFGGCCGGVWNCLLDLIIIGRNFQYFMFR